MIKNNHITVIKCRISGNGRWEGKISSRLERNWNYSNTSSIKWPILFTNITMLKAAGIWSASIEWKLTTFYQEECSPGLLINKCVLRTLVSAASSVPAWASTVTVNARKNMDIKTIVGITLKAATLWRCSLKSLAILSFVVCRSYSLIPFIWINHSCSFPVYYHRLWCFRCFYRYPLICE